MTFPLKGAARATKDHTACSKPGHVGGPTANASPVCLTVNGKRVVRLADYADCKEGPRDVVVEGAATFTVCGLPVARIDDGMQHEGHIKEGSSNVRVGGRKFALPANVKLFGSPDFVNKTIRDLYKLSTLPSGQELLDRLRVAGQPISIIEMPSPAQLQEQVQSGKLPAAVAARATVERDGSGPLAGWDTTPAGQKAGEAAAAAGTPTGSEVDYDPDFNVMVPGAGGQLADGPAFVNLGHELTHALANAEGQNMNRAAQDAAAPELKDAEAKAMGLGSHAGERPNENTIRDDAKLPRRTAYQVVPVSELSKKYRPGDCKGM